MIQFLLLWAWRRNRRVRQVAQRARLMGSVRLAQVVRARLATLGVRAVPERVTLERAMPERVALGPVVPGPAMLRGVQGQHRR